MDDELTTPTDSDSETTEDTNSETTTNTEPVSSPNSILTSIKKLLGINDSDTQFDIDIVMHINTVFSILTQLGVGPSSGFSIADKNTLWADFLGATTNNLELVKSYVYLRVKLLFDPPQSSFVTDAMERNAKELEWRIYVTIDNQTST